MITESKIKSLRNNYRNNRKLVYKDEVSKIKFQDLKRQRKEAQDELKRIQSVGEYDHLDQVQFYNQKFTEHIHAIEKAFKSKKKWKEITPEVKEIYKHEQFVQANSYLKQSNQKQLNHSPNKQTSNLDNFFDDKRSKIVPEVGFKSLLDNPPLTNKNFKTKFAHNNEELKRLRSENETLRSKLQSGHGLSSEQKNYYEMERKKFERQMRALQQQNRQLLLENESLRSQKSNSGVPSSKVSLEQQLYAPYFIQTQENDLYKINVRNQSEAGYTNIDPFDQQDYMRDFHKDFDTYSEPVRGNDNETYSVFDMTKSYFPEAHQINENSRLGIDNPQTAYRNKVSFFRNSGILVRDDDFQIGFKKSSLDFQRSRQKIILYFHNKTRNDQKIQVYYDYEKDYYDIELKEKAKYINAFKQARQVIEVSLNNYKQDLNSNIEMIVQLGSHHYKLWLPVLFIEFTRKISVSDSFAQTKVIRPGKGFSKPEEAKKSWEELNIRNECGEVWGISKVYEGPINLKWKSGNKLEVKTSQKWIDLLTFVMFDYQ